jgi:tRNA dimethylallyltransferase
MSHLVPAILVLLGPTASGKTDLALRIAKRTGAQILSVDSMQVYRDMNIGSAKPSPEQLACVKHHGIDLVNPNELYATAKFVELADALIADCSRQNIPLIATGGTPLYYKSLFEGIFQGPGADESLRSELRQIPNEELHRRLQEVDPAAAGRIHANDSKRLIRALEVFQITGKPISQWQSQWGSEHRHKATWVGLNWDKELLNRRINARAKIMIADGWIDETRDILAKYGAFSLTALQAAGYMILADHLAGKISLDDAIERIKIETRQLARRQMKWFRRFEGVQWLDGRQGTDVLDGQLSAMGW